MLVAALADAASAEDMVVDVVLPFGAFADVDGDDADLTAVLADGDPLPDWLSFDGARFTGMPPADFHGAFDIQVTASDGALSVSDIFRLTIDPVNDRPVVLTPLDDAMVAEDQAIDLALPDRPLRRRRRRRADPDRAARRRRSAARLAELRRHAVSPALRRPISTARSTSRSRPATAR